MACSFSGGTMHSSLHSAASCILTNHCLSCRRTVPRYILHPKILNRAQEHVHKVNVKSTLPSHRLAHSLYQNPNPFTTPKSPSSYLPSPAKNSQLLAPVYYYLPPFIHLSTPPSPHQVHTRRIAILDFQPITTIPPCICHPII